MNKTHVNKLCLFFMIKNFNFFICFFSPFCYLWAFLNSFFTTFSSNQSFILLIIFKYTSKLFCEEFLNSLIEIKISRFSFFWFFTSFFLTFWFFSSFFFTFWFFTFIITFWLFSCFFLTFWFFTFIITFWLFSSFFLFFWFFSSFFLTFWFFLFLFTLFFKINLILSKLRTGLYLVQSSLRISK